MYDLTPYPITPIGSFFGILLALLPLAARMKRRNLAIWMYSFWVAFTNLQLFVNTIIWHNNVDPVVPVWCDISTRLRFVAPIAVRACTLVLCIQVFKASRLKGTGPTESRGFLALSMALMLGLPILVMALHIIIEPLRFDIFEEIGCVATMISYVGYIIIMGPELVLSLAAAALLPFTMRKLRRMIAAKKEFFPAGDRDHGSSGNYGRQMVVVCLDTLINLPITITIIVADIAAGKDSSLNLPYTSWNNVHHGGEGNFPSDLGIGDILEIPAWSWSTNGWQAQTIKWDEWVYVVYAIVFFAAFGTTPEMRNVIRNCAQAIARSCGFRPSDKQSQGQGQGQFVAADPTYSSGAARNGSQAARRRDSLSFISDDSGELPCTNQEAPLAVEVASGSKSEEMPELRRMSEVLRSIDSPASTSDAVDITSISVGEKQPPEQSGPDMV